MKLRWDAAGSPYKVPQRYDVSSIEGKPSSTESPSNACQSITNPAVMLLRANARAAPTVYARYVQHWMQQPYLLTRSQSTSAPTADHALLQRDAATKSPVTRVHFRGQCVHVKRDDVFHLAGNKVRAQRAAFADIDVSSDIACCSL